MNPKDYLKRGCINLDVSHAISKTTQNTPGVLGELKPVIIGALGGGTSAFLSTLSTILSIVVSLLTAFYLVTQITVFIRKNYKHLPKWYHFRAWIKAFKNSNKED